MRRKIIGLTGPLQSGKQELAPVLTALGYAFLDLNKLAEQVRISDPEVHARYAQLQLLAGLDPAGKRGMIYYQKVFHVDGTHQAVMAVELPAVMRRTRSAIESMPGAGPLVVNWGYLYKMLETVAPDHILIYRSRQEVWHRRIKRRMMQGGWPSDQILGDNQIAEFLTRTEMEPERIIATVREYNAPFSVVDTSGDDWGESELRSTFRRLGW